MYPAVRDWVEERLWRQGWWIANPTVGSLRHRIRRFSLPDLIAELSAGQGQRRFIVDTRKVTTPYGFSFAEGGWHPYVVSLREAERSESVKYEESLLRTFHARFIPQTLQEALFEKADHLLTAELEQLPHSWPLIRDLWLLDNRAAEEYVAEARGMPPEMRSPHVGPVSLEAGIATYSRLMRAVESMRNHGYDPLRFDGTAIAGFDGFGADGYFLWRGNDYRFVLLHGHHRIAAAAFLGIERVHLRIRRRFVPLVSRSRLDDPRIAPWMGLKSKQLVFDSIFLGDGLSKAENWGLA
jgi:hypothetical protein